MNAQLLTCRRPALRYCTQGAHWAGAALIGAAWLGAAAASALELPPADMLGWEVQKFHGQTLYSLTPPESGPVLHARCDRSASGLFRRQTIDLTRTPVIEWSWRVDRVFEPPRDERLKANDDYAARIYLVVDGGLLAWRTRAVNYVWATSMPGGSDWPNAYAGQARMVAVRSGPPSAAGEWQHERRDVRADFKRLHGIDVRAIDAIAIMTDCDDRATTAEAWYGTIRFVAD